MTYMQLIRRYYPINRRLRSILTDLEYHMDKPYISVKRHGELVYLYNTLDDLFQLSFIQAREAYDKLGSRR